MRLSISLNMVKHFVDGGKKKPFFSSRKDKITVALPWYLCSLLQTPLES